QLHLFLLFRLSASEVIYFTDKYEPLFALLVSYIRCMMAAPTDKEPAMQWKNTRSGYGLVAIALHWLVALTVIGLAILGLWMVDLSYYSPWYRSAPFWHRSVGLALFAVLLLRMFWRCFNPRPGQLPNHRRWELNLAALVHGLLYFLLFVIVIS